MVTVRKLLESKSGEVWSIPSSSTAFKALEIMADKDVGALLVIDDGELVGVFSERDYARKVILKGRSSKETSVGELMTRVLVYVSPDHTVGDCMALMSAKRVRHLPVVENGQLIGIITIGDVVNSVISEQEVTIQDLENYITGHGYVA